MCLSLGCASKEQRNGPVHRTADLDSIPYRSILTAASTKDTLRDTAAYRQLEQWVPLESNYPEWGALVGDSIEKTDVGVLLWYHEPTGVSLCTYGFIGDNNTKEIVDGMRLADKFDADFASHFYETKEYLRTDDSIMIISSLMRYVKTNDQTQFPDEELEYERATVYVVKRGRFRRVGERWRDNKSLPISWEQFR